MLAEQKQFRCIPFLSMIYLVASISPYIFGRNCLDLFQCKISLTSLIFFTFWFVLNDIVAEIYGYKTARNFFCSVVITQLIFALISFFILKIRILSPQTYNTYLIIFGGFTTETIYASLIYIVAWRVNTFFLLKWKRLLYGQYFWLRNVGSSIIGIFLFEICVTLFYTFFNSSIHDYIYLKKLFFNLIFRIISIIILSGIAQSIIPLIKSIGLIEVKKTDIPELLYLRRKNYHEAYNSK